MKHLDDVLQGKEENYILPFFWQHGEDENVLRKYMQVIYDSNIRAVCIESRPHPDFCGTKWWTDMDIILEEAKRLGMKVWILDDSHFPTGFANGAMKNAPDELHHQYMVYRTLEMCGPSECLEFDVSEYLKAEPIPAWMPPQPQPERIFTDNSLVAVLACPVGPGEKLGATIDLTAQIRDNILTFNLQPGYWRIFIIYLTRNAKGRNDYINFLDKDSCRLLLNAVYESHYEHYKEYFGNVIAGFFSDEPPIGNTEGYMLAGSIGNPMQNLPWSKLAADRLSQEFGSTAWRMSLPYLWADAIDSAEQAKIRVAYMDMVTKLVKECFSEQNGMWCEAHGVEYIGHMLEDCDMNSDLGPSMGHFFRGLAGQHMAGIDNIGGQVMIGGQNVARHSQPACADEAGFYHYLLGKLGASHAAIDPKKYGRCMCENFGAYGWQFGTKEQKYMVDHFMVRGVNRFVPHAFSPAPYPDPDCPPHFYAHGENPLYRAFGELMAYTNRVCHFIDGGTACPDVAVLYNAESKWAGETRSNIEVARELTQSQIDFHVIPADVFRKENEYGMSFDGSKLKVNGNSYSVLVVSGCTFLDADVAEFIQKGNQSGYPVIFTEQLPSGIIAATQEENVQFKEKINFHTAVQLKSLSKEIKKILKPEVLVESEFHNLTTYHYQNDGDVYLLLNEDSDQCFDGNIVVKAKGKAIRYYPWENCMEAIIPENCSEGTRLHLSIHPLELCIIIFEEQERIRPSKQLKLVDVKELTKFRVSKVTAKNYDDKNTFFKEQNEAEEVSAPLMGMQKRYPDFSGYYFYDTEVELEANANYYLEIDDVSESAEVFVNDVSIGMKLQKPFVFDLSKKAVTGKNVLRIEVATLLERKLHSEGFDIKAMSPYRPLSPTGMIGKVMIKKYVTEEGAT